MIKEKIAKFREYLDYFERHYDNVQRAWAILNDKCDGKGFRFIYDDFVWHSIDAAVKMHDDSKLSAGEFTQYRQRFFPVSGEVSSDVEFLAAWDHHKDNNAHHWQNWTKNYTSNPYADIFLVEMV